MCGLFLEMTPGYAVFSYLLGSTVDTFSCQSTDACGISRISARRWTSDPDPEVDSVLSR